MNLPKKKSLLARHFAREFCCSDSLTANINTVTEDELRAILLSKGIETKIKETLIHQEIVRISKKFENEKYL